MYACHTIIMIHLIPSLNRMKNAIGIKDYQPIGSIGVSVVEGTLCSVLFTAVIMSSENGSSLVMLHSILSNLALHSRSLLQGNVSVIYTNQIKIINSYLYIAVIFWHTWVHHSTWLKSHHHGFLLHSEPKEH